MDTTDRRKCFNCLSKLGLDQQKVDNESHQGGIPISLANGEQTLVSFTEALIYIFELDPTGVQELQALNINEMSLCHRCHKLIEDIYNLRQHFQQLMSTDSCLFKIVFKFKAEPAPEPDDDIDVDSAGICNQQLGVVVNPGNESETSGDEHEIMEFDPLDIVDTVKIETEEDVIDLVSSPSSEESPEDSQPLPAMLAGVRMFVVDNDDNDAMPENEVHSFGESYLRCSWCSKHVPQSLHRVHVENCHKEIELQSKPKQPVRSRSNFYQRCIYCGEGLKTRGLTRAQKRLVRRNHAKHCCYNGPDRRGANILNPVTCPICKHPEVPHSALQMHMRTHCSDSEKDTLDPSKFCCGEEFTSRTKRLAHVKSSAHQKNAQKSTPAQLRMCICPECGKSVQSKYMRPHIKTHERPRTPAICDICQIPTPRYGKNRNAFMLVHRGTHLGEQDKLAMTPTEIKELQDAKDELDLMFVRKRQLRESTQIATTSAACPECGKIFTAKNVKLMVRNHINLIHRQNTGHSCEICAKPMPSDYAIKIHLITHMNAEERAAHEESQGGPKPRPLCDECGKSFGDADSLKGHIKMVHEKVPKPKFTCDKCGHSTTSTTTHKRHLRGHELEESGQYHFTCGKCPTKFKFKGEQMYHGPLCPGEAAERPHQCPEEGCGRRFKFRHHVEIHLNTFHKFKPDEAREIIYPGLPVPKFHGKKSRSKKRKKREASN